MTNEECAELLGGMTMGTVVSLKQCDDGDVNITHAGSDGQFAGWILTHEGRAIISTKPIFKTPDEARAHMKKVMQACREIQFTL